MKTRTDWSAIAQRIGAEERRADGGVTGVASSAVGRQVLEDLLGTELLEDAVEVAASSGPGAGAAESVLGVVRSRHATEYAYRRLREGRSPEERVGYAQALRCCAHAIALTWMDSLWSHEDPTVQVLAAKMLEGMIDARVVEQDEAAQALEQGSRHSSPEVREYVGYARWAFERVFGDG